MSLQVEKLENNTAKLTVEVDASKFDKAVEDVYKKTKNRFNVPGFRKGRAPLYLIEKMYGASIFYEDAANAIIPDEYAAAEKESGLFVVAEPEIEVVQIEKGKPFIFTAVVVLKPEVRLGKYKGIKVKAADITVTDEDVQKEIDSVRDQNARLVTVDDRPVADGDQAIIDFEGFVDGEPFDGGKAENYSLTIGSHSFIDTFEEQLIGLSIGEEKDVQVTFPDDYQEQSLAGKPATFRVTVKEIKVKELPEADDEFAQDVSEFDTLEEYKADIRKNIEKRKKDEADKEKEEEVVKAIVKDAKMDIPDKMVLSRARENVENFARRIQSQGISFEQYTKYMGVTPQQLIDQAKPQALEQIQASLVLEAVAKAENIEATQEDFDKEMEIAAKSYGMDIDKVKDMLSDAEKEKINGDIVLQKAAKFVTDAAK